jgi:uncharacterized membrane protein YcfT
MSFGLKANTWNIFVDKITYISYEMKEEKNIKMYFFLIQSSFIISILNKNSQVKVRHKRFFQNVPMYCRMLKIDHSLRYSPWTFHW